MKFNKYPVLLYLLLTLVFSTVIWIMTVHATDQGRIAGRLFGYGIMWAPALATVVSCIFLKRKISDLAWKWLTVKQFLACYFIPFLYSLIAYLVIWSFGWGGFYNKTFISGVAHEMGWTGLPDLLVMVLFLVLYGVIGMFASISTALGEEIGWRGFLLPELSKKMSFTGVSLTTGVIWAIWHFPLIIFSDYNNGTSIWFGLICFSISIVSACFIYTWYYMKFKSLWTGVIMHASHNLFIQGFFTPITEQNKLSPWYIGEFGIILPVISVIFAIYFWRRRGELNTVQSSKT